MWDFEKINSQNLEVQETKNIVRHPEGVQTFCKRKESVVFQINTTDFLLQGCFNVSF